MTCWPEKVLNHVISTGR